MLNDHQTLCPAARQILHCFVNKNLLLFCRSPSVAVVVDFVLIQNSATMMTWRHTSPLYWACVMLWCMFNDIFLDDIFLMYDIIVFEILGIHTYTRKRKAGVFKKLNSGELFWKDAFSVTVFTGHEWTVGQTGEKNLRSKKKRIRVDGAWTCYLFCRSCLCRSLRYLSLVFTSTWKRKHRHKKNGHV